ncbi:hypothetical protein [Actinomyces mediterranea]|uniref:hypothetical protein n=1 Tax=Actinomyces mediterranea TaxID=1871028 RepID=UPI000970AF5F|nr:hypothetical protein [Actinomyces mediterranea]
MSPFVCKVCNGGGTAVQIVEKVGRTNRLIEHVGTAHSEAELATLVEVAQERFHPDQGVLDVFDTGAPGAELITGKRSRWLWEILESAYARLGFDELVDKAFREFARIIERSLKQDVVCVLGEVGVECSSVRTSTPSSGRIGMIIGVGSRAWFAHATSGGGLSLVLYDVTTL